MKKAVAIGVLAGLIAWIIGGCPIPRDPHPERTPQPSRNYKGCQDWKDGCPLQQGTQPAPSVTS